MQRCEYFFDINKFYTKYFLCFIVRDNVYVYTFIEYFKIAFNDVIERNTIC
jgi:hypothetical protein